MDDLCDTGAELGDTQRVRSLAQKLANERHGITSIAHGRMVMFWRLARTAVDDSDIVVRHYDAIFTRCRRVLAGERLLNDDGP